MNAASVPGEDQSSPGASSTATKSRGRSWSRWALYGIQIGATGAIIWFLASYLSLEKIAEGLGRIPLSVLALGLAVYALATIGRVVRFRLLGAQHVAPVDMLAVVWAHNFFNNILPFRLGEVSYLVLAKRVGGLTAGTSGGAVAIARIADLLGLCAALVLALAISGNPLPISTSWVVGSLCAVCAGGATAIFLGRSMLALVLSRTATRRASFWWRKLDELRVLLSSVNAVRLFGPLFFSSLYVVLVGGLVNYWILAAVGVPLTYWQMLIALSISFLVAVLPIQPIGGWGIFEGAVVMGLGLYGIDTTRALQAGVALHVANYVFFVPLGLLGLLYVWRRR